MVERGIGQDRRPLIIIDERSFKRHHTAPPEAAPTVASVERRIAAKQFAFELAMSLGELVGVCMIMASIVLLAVAMGG